MIRCLAAAATAIVLVFSQGGCQVETQTKQPVVKREFDLSQPPSRAAVGLADGKADVIYGERDLSDFPLVVKLPEGKKIESDARIVGFASRSKPQPTTDPPSSMDIHYYAPNLEAGRDRLMAIAQEFGLKTDAFTKWYDQANAVKGKMGSSVESLWVQGKIGYLTLEVKGRYMPAPEPASAQTIVHYLFTWR